MSGYPYRLQRVRREGDLVHVTDVRNFVYHSPEYYEEGYYDRTYDLKDIVRASFVISGFERPMNMLFAHVFISFEFKNNVFLTVSAEAGRTMGELFSFYKGARYYYPLIYILADEYDSIRTRTNIHRYDTYMYPMNITKDQCKELLIDIVDRVNMLHFKPEKYHLGENSCISNLYDHINKLDGVHLPTGLGKFFPAWLDFFAYRRGFFDAPQKWWMLRYVHRINEVGKKFDTPDEYSLGIRNRLHGNTKIDTES